MLTGSIRNSLTLVRQRGLLSLGVGAVVVAISLAVASCNKGNNTEPSSGTSMTPTASTTVVSTSPNSSPVPGTYPPAPAPGDRASAEVAIRQGYVKKLADCYATHNAVANIVAINWNAPGFKENDGGSGTIQDADRSLGGDFTAAYQDGHWNIDYHWC